jgi:L-asparagine transporter-like permease
MDYRFTCCYRCWSQLLSWGVFAETEFWFAGVKVVVIIGLLILSLVIMLPSHDRLRFRGQFQDFASVTLAP